MEKKKTTEKIKISERDMTSLIEAIKEITDFVYSREEVLITNDIINDELADGNIPKKLLGYTVQLTDKQGDHRNDGQMVDYTFTFTSPKGVETDISTEMCLMCGWNFGTYEGKGYLI
jgi:hypothetical protein